MVYKHAISTIVPARNPRAGAEVGSTTVQSYQGSNVGTGYPMSSSSFERTSGYEHSGFGQPTHRQGGFSRTPPNQNFGGSFDRQSGYQSSQGYERTGFDNRGFGGGFDRSSYEERGFDGKSFESPIKKSFDNKVFGGSNNEEDN